MHTSQGARRSPCHYRYRPRSSALAPRPVDPPTIAPPLVGAGRSWDSAVDQVRTVVRTTHRRRAALVAVLATELTMLVRLLVN
jgi:hypothetical protein